MKVKIGDKVYDSLEEGSPPIMIVLADQDKENIANMHPKATKYCIYDEEEYTVNQIHEWMADV